MDAAIVFRVISLIPDRMPRMQSGCVFNPGSQPEQLVLLAKFLTWLAPLDPISKEEQQLLGVRSAAGRPLGVGEEEGGLEPLEPLEALEETSATVPGAGTGTQIAA
jgi:hypothetical protein